MCIKDLQNVFGTSELPFAGKTMLVLGDFYQLPPVRARRVYENFQGINEILNLALLWRTFQFAELTEVMRQRGDTSFIELLNRIRTGEPNVEDENILKSRFIRKDDPNYPLNELHMFAENAPGKLHNDEMLLKTPTYYIQLLQLTIFPEIKFQLMLSTER